MRKLKYTSSVKVKRNKEKGVAIKIPSYGKTKKKECFVVRTRARIYNFLNDRQFLGIRFYVILLQLS